MTLTTEAPAGISSGNSSLSPEAQVQTQPLRDRPFDAGLMDRPASIDQQPHERSGRRLWRWILIASLIALVGYGAWRLAQPQAIVVIHPRLAAVTESIAASGIVIGEHETTVGAQVSGTVERLAVREGSAVRRGEVLARIQNPIAAAQVRQAEAAIATAQAALQQAMARALPSDLRAATQRVRQAIAALDERIAGRARSLSARDQAEEALSDSQIQVRRAEAVLRQSTAHLALAKANLDRSRYLAGEGAISRQLLDQSQSEYDAANAEVSAQNEALSSALSHVASARSAIAVADQDVSAASAQVTAARSAVTGASADLETLRAQPRTEAVKVARVRVAEARSALEVALENSRSAIVRAPFDGIVTQIIAEVGAAAGPAGILRLVESGSPQVRLDLDENRLAELHTGQKAIITSAAYRGSRVEGRVYRIGSAVDSARGTVEVTVVPVARPVWIRPGHTVNVNIILNENVSRLLIPTTALAQQNDHRIVLVVRNHRALAQSVSVGDIEGDLAPVLGGLSAGDLVVKTASGVAPGSRVKPAEDTAK